MRKITDIYEQYKIMSHLQMHQLKVAAVAKQIIDALPVVVDTNAVLTACLLHDMGNVIKFNLVHTKEIFGFSDEEIQEIAHIQKEFIEKYGDDEHVVIIEIAKEIGVSKKIITLISQHQFITICIDKDGKNLEQKILHYADLRVGPLGILSYQERMDDAGRRYRNHPKKSLEEKKRLELVACGKEIEKQLFSSLSIKPEDITDESSEKIVDALKEFIIQ